MKHYAVVDRDGIVHRRSTPQSAAQLFAEIYPDAKPGDIHAGPKPDSKLADEPWPIPARDAS